MMDVSRIFDAFDTSFSDRSHDDDLLRAVSHNGLGGMSIVESSATRRGATAVSIEWYLDCNKKKCGYRFHSRIGFNGRCVDTYV